MCDTFTGEIRMFAGDYAPYGWALCDGRLLSVNQYSDLYALIGNTYGGDATTFKLPDLRGRIPVGQGTATGITSKNMGEMSGFETVVLTREQLPQHTHDIVVSNVPGTADNPQNVLWAGSSGNLYSTNTATPSGQMNAEAITATGSNPPLGHTNMMPFLAINYIICLNGDYFPQTS